MARKVISLDGGNWEFGKDNGTRDPGGVKEWMPAEVPGDVRADLLNCSRIEDPFPAKQNELSRWVDDWNWWYRREFKMPAGGRRTFIRFEGIDYKSHIFLNGRKLAENVGMFAPLTIEATGLLKPVNSLCVCVENTAQFRQREETLKCQMGFGWDFAPSIRTMGIWDSVSLISTGEAYIRFLGVKPINVGGRRWELNVSVEINAEQEIEADVEFTLNPDNFEGGEIRRRFDLTLPKGNSEHSFEISVDNPKLWKAWEDGRAYLYRLKMVILLSKKVIDDTSVRFGFRQVNLRENDGRPGDIWTFEINGQRKFIRGANWVPCDSMPGRVDEERYDKLLKMARDANINMLRIWGGGLREKKAFYDICDEKGILVWQEFPFSCPRTHHYPKTRDFLKLVDKER